MNLALKERSTLLNTTLLTERVYNATIASNRLIILMSQLTND